MKEHSVFSGLLLASLVAMCLGTASLKSLGENQQEINSEVVSTIKTTLKEPFINLLASSELITWSELKSRFNSAKQALEFFEYRYRTELGSSQPATPQQAALKTYTPPPAQPIQNPRPMTPGQPPRTMPGVTPGGFQAKPLPGRIIPAQKPPAVSNDDDDDDDDDSDDNEKPATPGAKPAMPKTMPGTRPAGMPGGMPVTGTQSNTPRGQIRSTMPSTGTQPTTNPGQIASGKVPGGMPMS